MTTEGTAGSGEISVAAGANVGEERVQLLVRVPDVGCEAVQVLDARDRPGADGRDELLKGQIRGICRVVGAGWVGRHSAPSVAHRGGGAESSGTLWPTEVPGRRSAQTRWRRCRNGPPLARK